MELAIKENFQLYKAAGIVLSLLLILLFQFLYPNRLGLRQWMANWKVNIPITVIDTLLLTLLCGACVCTWAVIVRENQVGFFERVGFSYSLQVAVTIVLLDLVAYLWHRANHVSGFLWRFHSVHHSDVHFEASTAFRFHPGELLISLGIRLIVVTITGLPILGLIAFELIYAFFNLLVHSDIRISKGLEWLLSFLVVTPSLHRRHHSEVPSEHNRNYGTILSIWDRAAQTWLASDADTHVDLGLPGQKGHELTLAEALTLPFQKQKGEESV